MGLFNLVVGKKGPVLIFPKKNKKKTNVSLELGSARP